MGPTANGVGQRRVAVRGLAARDMGQHGAGWHGAWTQVMQGTKVSMGREAACGARIRVPGTEACSQVSMWHDDFQAADPVQTCA